MIEETWLSIILKVIPETEAKERVVILAVALHAYKFSGNVEENSGDCTASGANQNISPWWGVRSSVG